MKKIILILTLVLSLLLIVSCAGNGGSGSGGGTGGSGDVTGGNGTSGGGSNDKCKITLITSQGVSVIGDNPLYVDKGSTATIRIELGSTMVFKSSSAGVYDEESGTLTIENVKRDMRVEVIAEDTGYDTSVLYDFKMVGTDKDSSSVANGSVRAGTSVTLVAGDDKRVFIGWTVGGNINVGELISSDREYSFSVNPDMMINNRLYIFANYADSNMLIYDPNGGQVNWSSSNLSATKYYTASEYGDKVRITLSPSYFEVTGSVHTFWHDGSFTREGYVLREYNTRPDGSGESYGLGSIYALTDGATLYCIWSEDTPHSDFTYTDITLPMPSGVDAKKAPNWVTNGVMITSYTGNDTTVTVPEKIDGKYVTAIGAGAFEGRKIETLVLSKYILKIEDGAFVDCSSLTTFYYPDTIYYISNDAFDEATYSNFHNLYVNAMMAPRYATGAEGAFAIKLMRIMANADKPRFIVISGSSTYLGLSTLYFEKLTDGEYCAINFGTTRTTHGFVYLEAMKAFADEDDVIVYAPENSIYMLGDPALYWKSLRDFECMYNLYWNIDIANYQNVFGAFAEFNTGSPANVSHDKLKSGRYMGGGTVYEVIVDNKTTDHLGEYINSGMASYCKESNYVHYYNITMNNRCRSNMEGSLASSNLADDNWRESEKWCSLDDPLYVKTMNAAIRSAKESGAKVYFGYCPTDAAALIPELCADATAWLDAYEALLEDIYEFDGLFGEPESYIYDHKYFFNNAYHTNDYGKVYRTYALYVDLYELLGKEVKYGVNDVGEVPGCLFEDGAVDGPVTKVDFLNN